MKLPAPVYGDGLRKSTQIKFDGYSMLSTEGGICDMQNMSSDYWPELASRPRRRILGNVEDPRGFGAWKELIWADERDFHYGEDVTLEGFLGDYERHQFVALGDYVTIWPDKLYYDTVSGDYGSLAESLTVSGTTFLDGGRVGFYTSELKHFRVGDAVTISGCAFLPENNKTFLVQKLRTYGARLAGFEARDNTFALDPRPFYEFQGENVIPAGTSYHFSGVEYQSFHKGYIYSFTTTMDIGWDYKLKLSGLKVLVYGSDNALREECAATRVDPPLGDEIVFDTSSGSPYLEEGAITFARTVPDMDYVFAHDNRLWGCKSDTIYVSKLGDIFNWNVYDGLASDSWTTETGTTGDFTGGISFGGYPRFFKQNQVITVYGDYPAEYAFQAAEQLGVAEGSGRSLCIVNSRLFFLSDQGPVAYAGGYSQLISEPFGVTRYRNGVSGTDGVKLYMSMEDEKGDGHLFVLDTRRGIWVREDDLRPVGFGLLEGDLYAMDETGEIVILGRTLNPPDSYEDEEDVAWAVEFGDIASRYPDRKRITKIQLRLELEEKAGARVLLKYDSEDDWRTAAEISARRKRSVVIPVVPRRTDHFRLRIEGTGDCRISSMAVELARGSERK